MAQSIDFFDTTFWHKKEFCDNLTCRGHKPGVTVYIYPKSNIKFYLLNRQQLNEFWKCCVEDQKVFCEWSCTSCRICKWVTTVYNELRDHFFFDFDRQKDKQPILWKVFSSYLDKKLLPCSVEIEIAERK